MRVLISPDALPALLFEPVRRVRAKCAYMVSFPQGEGREGENRAGKRCFRARSDTQRHARSNERGARVRPNPKRRREENSGAAQQGSHSGGGSAIKCAASRCTREERRESGLALLFPPFKPRQESANLSERRALRASLLRLFLSWGPDLASCGTHGRPRLRPGAPEPKKKTKRKKAEMEKRAACLRARF